MYVMAAMRVRDVPGAWHLTHEIGPGIPMNKRSLPNFFACSAVSGSVPSSTKGKRSKGSSAESTIRGIGFRGAAANACLMFRRWANHSRSRYNLSSSFDVVNPGAAARVPTPYGSAPYARHRECNR